MAHSAEAATAPLSRSSNSTLDDYDELDLPTRHDQTEKTGSRRLDMSMDHRVSPEQAVPLPWTAPKRSFRQRALYAGQVLLLVIVVLQFVMFYRNDMRLSGCGIARSASARIAGSELKGLPDYYQTSPQRWAGMSYFSFDVVFYSDKS